MATWNEQLRDELDAIRQQGRYRHLRVTEGRQAPRMTIDGRPVLLFAGANYLGLAGHPKVVQAASESVHEFGCAAGGARLISGNLSVHERLEEELAQFLGTEAALLFSTGYMANLGLITALVGKDDVLVSDSLNHASIIDAGRMSRATVRVFAHNDVDDLRRVARELSGFRRRLLVVDGVFSMDGDTSRLRDIVPIAREHEMAVVVDDAHGVGVLGDLGRGVVEVEGVQVDAVVGNLGKSLGSFGAFVACSALLRDYLINTSRQFIFTCGVAPASAAAARAALQIVQQEPHRRREVSERTRQLRAGLQAAGYQVHQGSTQIVPAIVGSNQRAMQLAEMAWEQGVFVQGIRFPSVPEGTARLRFTAMYGHSTEDVDRVIDLFSRIGP